MSKGIALIVGSSRPNGNTVTLASWLANELEEEYIDLARLNISYYDYEHKNIDDDFLGVVQRMIESQTIVLLTPVYWYSMSAQMKTFVDRISDLVTIRKDLGRKLRGKNLFLLSTGAGKDAGFAFEAPIEQTATYLGINFKGFSHFFMEKPEDVEVRHRSVLKQLITQIKQ